MGIIYIYIRKKKKLEEAGILVGNLWKLSEVGK